MKLPDALAEGGFGLHEEIEEMFSGHAHGGGLPARKTPIRVGDRANATFAHEPDTWRPKKGDKPPKERPLTLPQAIAYCNAQAKKWQNQAKADDFKEMKCCDAYSLLAQQAKHIAELLKRLKPRASASLDTAAAAKKVVKKLLSSICGRGKVISTADAVRILVPAFPDLFEGVASLKSAGKRLQGLLQKLGVSACNVRSSGKVVKGYRVAELRQA
jgi:hypothetical protein